MAAAQAVHNSFKQEGCNIVYINVMNNLSVDCDCDGSPATPQLKTICIVTLEQVLKACKQITGLVAQLVRATDS